MVEVFRAIIVEHTVCPCINFSGQLAICTVTSFTTKTRIHFIFHTVYLNMVIQVRFEVFE